MSAVTDLLEFLVSEEAQRQRTDTDINYLYVPIPLLIAAFTEMTATLTLFGAGAPVGAVAEGTIYFDTSAAYKIYVYDNAQWNEASANLAA